MAGGLVLVLVAGALALHDLGAYPLLDPDEGRHAEIAREMATGTGIARFFRPTLGLEPYREKPPAFYWLVALAYRALGIDETAARLPSAATSLITILAAWLWIRPRGDPVGALAAGLVLATSLGWFGLARYTNLDMTLTACAAVGVLAGLAWLDRASPRGPTLCPWVAAGLGTLVKGPIALALVMLPLALAGLAHPRRPTIRELRPGRGLLAAGVIVAAGYVPLAIIDPDYLRHFAATNLSRFSVDSPHAGGPAYYLLWLPVLFLPWTLFAGPALVRAARDPRRRGLVLWAVAVPALLTLPRGKLATYALSALVPLALIVGPELAAATAGERPGDSRALGIGGWLGVVLLLAAVPAVIVVGRYYPTPHLASALIAATALGWALALVRLLRRGQAHRAPLVALGAALTLYPLAVGGLAPAVASQHSDRALARAIGRGEPGPVIAFAAKAPSLVFYLERPVTETDDPEVVRVLFARDAPAYLVTGRRHFAEIEALLGPRVHRWTGTQRRRLYANRPPPQEGAS